MKKLITLALVLIASACFADDFNRAVLQVDLGVSTSGTFTTANAYNGFIDSIYVSGSDAVSTGNVVVSVIPVDSLISDIVVATNDVTATKVFRPRVDSTDVAGTALTNDGPERYILVGEKLKINITGSPTGSVWIATVNINR